MSQPDDLWYTFLMPSPDLEKDKAEILALHRAAIQAHLEKNVEFFVQDVSDNYVSVSRGEITHPTEEETRVRFTNYLHNTTFAEYQDLQDPIIHVSSDGTMAWSIVQVRIRGTRKMTDQSEVDFDTVSAWIMVYENVNGRWVRTANVSTFK